MIFHDVPCYHSGIRQSYGIGHLHNESGSRNETDGRGDIFSNETLTGSESVVLLHADKDNEIRGKGNGTDGRGNMEIEIAIESVIEFLTWIEIEILIENGSGI